MVGPFSWIPSSADDSPRVFDVPESRKCGLYLFAVSASAGELIYWVGQTSQPVRTRLANEYTYNVASPFLAAERGELDGVIEPAQTRVAIAKALRALRRKQATLPPKKHGNIPL